MGLYLLDYGAGNVRSLANTLTKLGYEFQWIACPQDFDKATKLIFPGVGAFQSAIDHLRDRGLFDPLKNYINSGKPYFGICIGLQVLFASSTENPTSQGLAVIQYPIERFRDDGKSVPHMGWNSVSLMEECDDAPSVGQQSQEIKPQHQVAQTKDGVDESQFYYFVHSYRAAYDPSSSECATWTHSIAQYGTERFIASVKKGNVLGTQFHPEKSGPAGLALLDAWLSKSEEELMREAKADAGKTLKRVPRSPGSTTTTDGGAVKIGPTKRVIACMDVRANDQGDLVVTKGDQYDVREKSAAPSSSSTSNTTSSLGTLKANTAGAVRNLGKPVALAEKYYLSGADELCLLNITSFRHSPLQDQPMLAVVRAAAENVFVPLTIGGGIKDTVDPDGRKHSALEVAGAYFRAGADKVSIGSEAVIAVERMISRSRGIQNPEDTKDEDWDSSTDDWEKWKGDGTSPMETIARAYGSQAVVVSIDPKRCYVSEDSPAPPSVSSQLITSTNSRSTLPSEVGKSWYYRCTISGGRNLRPLTALQLALGSQALGAGELLINCIDRDGTNAGFDMGLLNQIKNDPRIHIPVVASSGVGKAEHFVDVFEETNVEAALAAGIFHREEVTLEEVKRTMVGAGLRTRV